ncbi:MAG: NAD(P)H-dependent oxidoreductase subunit E [Nitrososphaeria archaeon]
MTTSTTSLDKRLILIDKAIEKYDYRKDSLLEILHIAQNLYGYIDKNVLLHISKRLRLPPSQVYGVVTFYKYFRTDKVSPHTIAVCLGTACYTKGSGKILSSIERELGIKCGEVKDNKLSLSTVYHIGHCATAPNIIIDGEVIGNVSEKDVIDRIKRILR